MGTRAPRAGSRNLVVPEHADPLRPKSCSRARRSGRDRENAGDRVDRVRRSRSPHRQGIATGLQRFETRVAEGIRAVDFYLNGSKVLTRTRAPSGRSQLGPLPRKQTIRWWRSARRGNRRRGESPQRGPLHLQGEDSLPEKAQGIRATRVIAPSRCRKERTFRSSSSTRTRRGSRRSTRRVRADRHVRDSKGLGYVRITGRSTTDGSETSGTSTRRATFPKSPSTPSLYASVGDKGRPVAGCRPRTQGFEGGVIQKWSLSSTSRTSRSRSGSCSTLRPRCWSARTPTGGDLLSRLHAREKDRAFTVSRQRAYSGQADHRKNALRSMGGSSGGRLDRALRRNRFGLYSSPESREEGARHPLRRQGPASNFDYDTTLEYVRKAGISVYGIGLKISGGISTSSTSSTRSPASPGARRSTSTPPKTSTPFTADHTRSCAASPADVLLDQPDRKDQWRKVDVKVEPTNLQARTITGYYPYPSPLLRFGSPAEPPPPFGRRYSRASG